jgi:hypothetical protein
MESSERGALSLVRLVAGCLIIFGLLDAGMSLTQYLGPYLQQQHHVPVQHSPSLNIFRLLADSIPIIAGIVIFIKAKAIAEWLSDMIQ